MQILKLVGCAMKWLQCYLENSGESVILPNYWYRMWSLFVGFEKTSQYKMEKLHFLCSLHSTKLSFLQKTVRRMNVANKYKNMKNSWTKHFALVIRLVASSNVITLLILLCIMLRNSKHVLKISWCSFFKERGIVESPTNHVEGRYEYN